MPLEMQSRASSRMTRALNLKSTSNEDESGDCIDDNVSALNEEVFKREPWLADTYLPSSGWVASFPEEATFGAAVRQETVDRLLVQDDKVTGIVTSSGNIMADHVVLAAGLGTIELAATLSIDVPVNSRPSLIVHSKPVSARLLNSLAISNGPHMRQTVQGRVIADRGNPTTDPAAVADIFKKVQAMFRSNLNGTPLPSLELDFYTVGIRSVPRDGLPILGYCGKKGLTMAVMHSGVNLAAFVGQTLEVLVTTRTKDEALEQFTLSRVNKD
ncbi:hypothetical protein SBRCBS47491_004639 [Sporothrix bragantina]|uniref:FAD dependent oxidoreductase domain-containing protein n=1 Tax=Sporothrix bragantina TaxID=671064 RepID=A0ABP0BQ81_9PEZI